MQSTKQIVDFSLHKFLEKIEEAILEGYRVHKTPTSYAKLIGGRYNVVMVKADEDAPKEEAPEKEAETEVVKPATRKPPAKKTGEV